jgi:hypothetical protein
MISYVRYYPIKDINQVFFLFYSTNVFTRYKARGINNEMIV